MNYPDFLIIGAMKSGSTTLYRDLQTQSRIFFPIDKEPNFLCVPNLSNEERMQSYNLAYQKKKHNQLAGDASTAYSKLPDYPDVSATARKVLGSKLKIIYIVRNPIDRIISHHHHDFNLDNAEYDINTEVLNNPKYIQYSSYAMQLTPWIEEFGRDNIRILIFEEYIANRAESIRNIMTFLGEEYDKGVIDENSVFNRSSGKVVVSEFWKKIITNKVYKTIIRPCIPNKMRGQIQKIILQKSCDNLPPMTTSTRELLKKRLHPEIGKIEQFSNRNTLWYN